MYVLACIPIYGDRGRDLCCDPAGSQESAPELILEESGSSPISLG